MRNAGGDYNVPGRVETIQSAFPKSLQVTYLL